MKSKIWLIVFLLLICVTTACDSAYPFLMVEVCLGNQSSYPRFVNLMRSIAEHNQMDFLDSSIETEAELNALSDTLVNKKQYKNIINIGFQSANGAWVMAVNSGMPKHQVLIGFSAGSEPEESKAFAAKLIGDVSNIWNVEYVPPGQGATGMAHCDAKE